MDVVGGECARKESLFVGVRVAEGLELRDVHRSTRYHFVSAYRLGSFPQIPLAAAPVLTCF